MRRSGVGFSLRSDQSPLRRPHHPYLDSMAVGQAAHGRQPGAHHAGPGGEAREPWQRESVFAGSGEKDRAKVDVG